MHIPTIITRLEPYFFSSNTYRIITQEQPQSPRSNPRVPGATPESQEQPQSPRSNPRVPGATPESQAPFRELPGNELIVLFDRYRE
jgi:hypothetical protein